MRLRGTTRRMCRSLAPTRITEMREGAAMRRTSGELGLALLMNEPLGGTIYFASAVRLGV